MIVGFRSVSSHCRISELNIALSLNNYTVAKSGLQSGGPGKGAQINHATGAAMSVVFVREARFGIIRLQVVTPLLRSTTVDTG